VERLQSASISLNICFRTDSSMLSGAKLKQLGRVICGTIAKCLRIFEHLLSNRLIDVVWSKTENRSSSCGTAASCHLPARWPLCPINSVFSAMAAWIPRPNCMSRYPSRFNTSGKNVSLRGTPKHRNVFPAMTAWMPRPTCMSRYPSRFNTQAKNVH